MTQSVGLYGGSFDPIHFGHLISARSLAEHFGLDRIVLIPSARPPHKPEVQLAGEEHRIAMVRAAVGDDPLFEVSDLEFHREGPSYTIDTVAAMQQTLGASVELSWIIGADSLPELPTWYCVADLVKRVRIITATRPGWQRPDCSTLAATVGLEHAKRLLANSALTPAIDISATDIRQRAASGLSIRYLVPAAVASYIHEHRLYAGD